MERLLRIRIAVIGGALFAIAVVYSSGVYVGASGEQLLQVRFLDVGQGDAIHITTPDGVEVVIDGGASPVVLGELSESRSFFDRYIDVVIATHPDTDHVGGLIDVLDRYDVGTIMQTAAENDAPAAVAYAEAAATEGARVVEAQAGQIVQLGASTTLEILSPRGNTENWQSNTASVVAILRYGETAFMLTGDAPQAIEDYLVGTYGAGLTSQVLKLGHHGSQTSTSENFLAVVQPQYAVVSAAADNRYGHPHAEVIARTVAAEAEILHTKDGTVDFLSDGTTVWLVE